MISSVASSCKFASLLLVAVLLCVAAPTASAADINSICSRTRNPPFCLSVLNSINGAAGANLTSLCESTIGVARANATGTLSLIKSLINKATDPQLKKKLFSCSDYYDNAAGELDDAVDYLKSGDYVGVNLKASAAMDYAEDCKDELGSATTPLPKNNEQLEDICSIILVIANDLRGRIIFV